MTEVGDGNVNALLSDSGADWAAVTGDGDWLLVRAGDEGFLVEVKTGEVRTGFPAHRYLGPAPDATGSAFVTATEAAVEIRSLPDGNRRHSVPGTPTSQLIPGRGLLAPGGEAVYLGVDPAVGWARYDPSTGEVAATYERVSDDEMIGCFALSADGSRVATGGIKGPVSEGFLAFYDSTTGDVIEHEATAYGVDQVALSPDGSEAVVCDGIGGLAGENWRADDLDGVVVDARFVRDGRQVVSLTVEGTLDRWDAANGERLGTHETNRRARFLSATDDGSLAALSGETASLVETGWST